MAYSAQAFVDKEKCTVRIVCEDIYRWYEKVLDTQTDVLRRQEKWKQRASRTAKQRCCTCDGEKEAKTQSKDETDMHRSRWRCKYPIYFSSRTGIDVQCL